VAGTGPLRGASGYWPGCVILGSRVRDTGDLNARICRPHPAAVPEAGPQCAPRRARLVL